jgi:xanthine dehydrogenase YagR molybdenum-binding subunit
VRAARERHDLHVDTGVERRADPLQREGAAERRDEPAGDEGDQIGLRGDPQGLEVARHGERDPALDALVAQPQVDVVGRAIGADDRDVAGGEKLGHVRQAGADRVAAADREDVGVGVQALAMEAGERAGRAADRDVERARELVAQGRWIAPRDDVEPDLRGLRADPGEQRRHQGLDHEVGHHQQEAPRAGRRIGRRQETIQDLRIAATPHGELTAITHDTVAPTSMFGEYADPTATVSRVLYACPHVATSHRLVRVHAPQPNPMRVPGEGPGSFALESALDELAHELGLDPLALRLRNHAEHDQHTGLPWSSNQLRACYRAAADAFGWRARPAQIGSLRDGRHRLGWGMATACYPVYRMASHADVRVDPTLGAARGVIVRCGTQDLGTGTATILAQLAAAALGVPPGEVTVEIGDTQLPEGPYSGGAHVTASVTPAVEQAAHRLRHRLIERAVADPASPLFGLAPDQLAIAGGTVTGAGRSEPLAALVARTGGLACTAHAAPDPEPRTSSYAHGAVFVEVAVDPELGEVRVRRICAAYACGRILNPLLARSQLVGGLVLGIGMALHEATVTDARSGRVVHTNLADYAIAGHADMPRFDVALVDDDDPHLPGGVKGVGMIGTVGVAAAIANAVFHATGRRIRDLPIRLESFLA